MKWILGVLVLLTGCSVGTTGRVTPERQARQAAELESDRKLVAEYHRLFEEGPEADVWKIVYDGCRYYSSTEPEFRDGRVIFHETGGRHVTVDSIGAVGFVSITKLPARIHKGKPVTWEQFSSEIRFIVERFEPHGGP